MTEFVSDVLASIGAIQTAYRSSTLDTAILTDPVRIQAFKDSIAVQMNDQSNGPTFEDLSDRIAGITLETSAQGASILAVSLIDPMWVLPNSGFIQIDDMGYIWPPIDIRFPQGTNCWWRLCQLEMNWDAQLVDANITLTFEDRIASLLREMSSAIPGAISQGQPNQTLLDFLQSLVDSTNHVLHLSPADAIHLIRLIDKVNDPNATVTLPSVGDPPAPSKHAVNKVQQGLTASQQSILDGISNVVNSLFSHKEQVRIQDAENEGWAKANQLQHRGSQVWSTPGSGAGNVP